MQTSGSLYGALIGSVLAFNIADFLGNYAFLSVFILDISFQGEADVTNFIFREKKRVDCSCTAVSCWSPYNSISSYFSCIGGWEIGVWNRNWIGMLFFMRMVQLNLYIFISDLLR